MISYLFHKWNQSLLLLPDSKCNHVQEEYPNSLWTSLFCLQNLLKLSGLFVCFFTIEDFYVANITILYPQKKITKKKQKGFKWL